MFMVQIILSYSLVNKVLIQGEIGFISVGFPNYKGKEKFGT